MKLQILACEVFFREVCLLAANSPHTIDVAFMPKGLHDLGVERMAPRLQKQIDTMSDKGYDTIVMDPPKFGRGPKGEVWEFFKSFPALCKACREVVSEYPLFVLLTAYAKRASAPELKGAIGGMMAEFGGSVAAGELATVERSAGRVIPHSLSICWSAE